MVKINILCNGMKLVSLIRRGLPVLVLLFSIHAYAWQGGGGGSLACNDQVNAALDIDCRIVVEPDMVLEGQYPGVDADYLIQISGRPDNVIIKPGDYTVTVTYVPSGNRCWGKIKAEDKLPPQLETCPCPPGNTDPNCEFLCSDEAGILAGTTPVPEPVVIENCGPFTTKFTDQITETACGEKTILRYWRFEDQYGNVNQSCISEYRLRRLTLGDVTPPYPQVNLPCGSGTSMIDIYNYFRPLVGISEAIQYAWPSVNGVPINVNSPVCNLVAVKNDTEIPLCGPNCPGSVKVLRTWTVIDWCTGDNAIYAQVISTADNEAPEISADDITVSVDPWGCQANVLFPLPISIKDNCDPNPSYSVKGPAGIHIILNPSTNRYIAFNVPKGIHEFYYEAKDCCGNIGRDTILVNVRDLTPPVAIAKEFIVISLTSGGDGTGIAKMYANSVDNGSYDGCTPVHLEVRRDSDRCGITGNATFNDDGHPFDGSSNPNSPNYDPDGGAYVKFCCEDLTDVENGVPFGIVKVWLRVWDDGDMDGVYGSAGDNYNETWSFVRVEDKLPPVLLCPPNVTINCDEDCKDLDLTGRPTAFFTCGPAEVDYTDIENLNDCGIGTVTRRWFIKSKPSVFCTQIITKAALEPFSRENIIWPPAEVTTTCKNINQYKPTWVSGPCDLIGYSVKSDTFYFEEGSCLKILNKYTIVDWCQYEPNINQEVGIWEFTQVIKVLDNVPPVIECEDLMFEVNDNNDADNDGNKCEIKELRIFKSATDNGDCASRWLKWNIFIDINGDGVLEYEYTSFLPSNDNSWNDSNGNGIPDRYFAPSGSGDLVSILIPEDIQGSMLTHKVIWKVTDGCGNYSQCTTNFMVVDKKKPTPYCVHISSGLMADGTVELWAKDFDLGSFDNCTDQEDLLFTFNQEHPVLNRLNETHYFKGQGQTATIDEYRAGNAQQWRPDFNSSALVFNCDDLPFADVQMTVWDEKLNFDYCTVRLNLVDNQDACGNDGGFTGSISGKIKNKFGQGFENAYVLLESQTLSELSKTIQTGQDGIYIFDSNPMYQDYKIEPRSDGDFLNGVSTLDLVMIQRHILQTSTFTEAYQFIAADVNNDEKVSTADLIELRKLILGVIDKFSNNRSWRMVKADQDFPDITNPWPLDETIIINNLDADIDGQDFVSIKVGDVNFNAVTNLNAAETESRNASLKMILGDPVSQMNGTLIPVYSGTDAIIFGLQLELKSPQAQIRGIVSGDIIVDEFHTKLVNQNQIRISVDVPQGVSVNTIDPLFYINVDESESNLNLSIDLETQLIKPEVYIGEELTTAFIHLARRSNAENIGEEAALFQNEPNPFKGFTTIGFYLPESAEATLSVYDMTGRLLYKKTATYNRGFNTVGINAREFSSPGLMYYTLESGSFTATKKMIEIE